LNSLAISFEAFIFYCENFISQNMALASSSILSWLLLLITVIFVIYAGIFGLAHLGFDPVLQSRLSEYFRLESSVFFDLIWNVDFLFVDGWIRRLLFEDFNVLFVWVVFVFLVVFMSLIFNHFHILINRVPNLREQILIIN